MTTFTISHATAAVGFTTDEQNQSVTACGASPHDTVTIDAAVEGGIKEVRNFANQLLLSPQFGDVRLGVIYKADKLTPQAQNALLKLLEEPPARVKLVLFIDREAEVLPTVLSRCTKQYGTGLQSAGESKVRDYNNDAIAQFAAAETLAKEEDITDIARVWLSRRYEAWCQAGRPLDALADIERFWHFYVRVDSPSSNKRLLLEQLVLSSL